MSILVNISERMTFNYIVLKVRVFTYFAPYSYIHGPHGFYNFWTFLKKKGTYKYKI